MERTITVWGKPHTVKISQSSRTSWSVIASIKGEILHGRGTTASTALANWAAQAKSKTRA
jgi:hypothetical protein